jgi:hypothetical protein
MILRYESPRPYPSAVTASNHDVGRHRRPERPPPFAREADMLAPLAAERAQMTPRNIRGWETYFEVQTLRGVVDILFVVPDANVLATREAFAVPPVTDSAQASTLLALTALSSTSPEALSGASLDILASLAPVGREHLRRRVLPLLTESGWVTRCNDGTWTIRTGYRIPLKRIVAVEVKRESWRRGLTQAVSHTEFADTTFVALDAAHLPPVSKVQSAFVHAGVGLVSVERAFSDDLVRGPNVGVLLAATRQKAQEVARAVVAERVVALREAGAWSGEVGHVFGRHVTTSGGEDPRRVYFEA